jgi:hypothetical protein
MTTEYSKIVNLLENYFDLLYKGDVELIKKVFLPDARIYTVTNDIAVCIDMDLFHERVASRQSPESLNKMRDDRIISIDMAGPKTALAKVGLWILPSGYYIDYLSLLKAGGNWRISSKVFHMEASEI